MAYVLDKEIRLTMDLLTVALSGKIDQTAEVWLQVAQFLPPQEFYDVVSNLLLKGRSG